jgi:hypothetical protein
MPTRTQGSNAHPQLVFLLALALIAVLAGVMTTVVPWI